MVCISAETPLYEVVQRMSDNHQSCAIVVDCDAPSGIITERNLVEVLLKSQYKPDLLRKPVSDFMSSPAITLHETENLFDAIVINRSEKVRHLPVVDNQNKLVGLVTQTDLTNAYFKLIEIQAEVIEKSIAEKTRDLSEENQELLMLSMEDHLMQIGNRRAMEADLQHTHEHAVKNQQHYAIVLLDVDYFKNYNDHYGHHAGDDALRQVAQVLKRHTRGSDRLYRYGGEEILLLLPNCNKHNAYQTAQRHLQSIAELRISHEKSPLEILTSSAGVGHIDPEALNGKSWQDVVTQADERLYAAKQAGRNQAQCTT